MSGLARTKRRALLLLAAAVLTGCAEVDDISDRTTTMNLEISNSENRNILFNLARASESEPLSFSSLASYTGHQSISGSLGIPVIGATGNQLRIQSVMTSGTSASGSLNNDFSYVANDDNATYSALLQPIQPNTIGYFLKQEYPRELLFFLFVSEIRIVRAGSVVKDYVNRGITARDIEISGEEHNALAEFGTELQSLLDSGLTAQLDLISGSDAKLCFDSFPPLYADKPEVHKSVLAPSCEKAAVIPATNPKPSKNDKGKTSPADDGNAQKASAGAARAFPFTPYFTFKDTRTDDTVQISFRSTFGIYNYLGRLIKNRIFLKILRDPSYTDQSVFRVTHDRNNCFILQEYRGTPYCVPDDSDTTKKVFSILHDLVKLYTFPTSAPQTLSARLIPGG